MPAWVIPSFLLAWICVMLLVHKRLSVWERLFLALPPVALATIAFVTPFYPTSSDKAETAGRIVFLAWVGWQVVLLIMTRNRHF